MCSICAGSVCGGTGGCQAAAQVGRYVISNPAPIAQVTVTHASNSLVWMQSLFASFVTVVGNGFSSMLKK